MPPRGSSSVPSGAEAFNQALNRRVRELRRRAGLTQAHTAAALGLNLQTYIHFEKRSPLPASLIVPFAELVGVDVRYLLTGETRAGGGA